MNSTPRSRPRSLFLVLAVVAVLAAVAAWTVPALAAPKGWTPPDTIVEIEGDKENGFTID